MHNAERGWESDLREPAPCTCSSEDVRKAQALREALRRRLLPREESKSDPYWSVGAE